jgi:hypothetical protein
MSTFSFDNKLISVPLKFGAIGGLIVIILNFVFYFAGKNPLVEIKFIDIPLLVIFIFFSLKEFRDRYNEKELHFWQGITGGMLTFITMATISALFILVLLTAIDPAITTNYIESRIALLNENKQTLIESIDEQAYIDAMAGVKETTPFDLALDDFLKKSIIGLFLTIIIALILRK